MKKLMRHNKFIICLLITGGSLALTGTVFMAAFGNIASAATELWLSFLVYIRFLIFLQPPTERPIQPPSGDINLLPSAPGDFWSDLGQFFTLMFNGENFTNYWSAVGNFLLILFRVLPFILLLWIAIKKWLQAAFTKHNNKYNKDTLPLKGFRRLSTALYVPPARYTVGLWQYIKSSRWPKIWLLIWLFNFNIFALILSVVSVVLVFSITFDFVVLYYWLVNSVGLLSVMFRFIPWWLWIIPVLWWIDRWRKRKALQRLRHMENMNKGFILDRSICTMFVGTMGKGKTTLMTDIVLSTETIFRHKAYELLLEIDLKFPHFPWIVFENELKHEMKKGRVFNLASCAAFVAKYEKKFKRGPTRDKCWTYDFKKYGFDFDDKKTVTSLWDALRDYSKLYFIYTINSTLILSNYSIRTDFQKIDSGNLPLWNMDFFDRDSKNIKRLSRHSHILDFDMLRLGKKLIDKNKNASAFEFGVIAITEAGKERGNQYKDMEIKETIKQLRATIKDLDKAYLDSEKEQAELLQLTTRATHLTDKFNDSLKLIRHKCTIAGFPFARVFLDEQRPESLGADARDLCEIVHIRDKSETKLAMPFYFIGELVYAFTFPRFKGVYRQYRFNRGDNTLLMYCIKKIGAAVHRSYSGIYNRFSYHVRYLTIEDGATGRPTKRARYFLSTKKIYSDRFSTDAYGDIFADGLKSCKVGLDKLPEYAGVKATEDELKKQNSYFVNEIVKYGSSKGGGK